MGKRLLFGLDAIIAALTILGSPFIPSEVEGPQPAPFIPSGVEGPQLAAAPLIPSAVEGPLDASTAQGVVTITLERNGQPLPGPRLVLRDAMGLEASGTTDVMGMVSFELAVGTWLVMSPEGLDGQQVEVTAQPSRVTLTMRPLRHVEGIVVDEQGNPAVGVPLMSMTANTRFSLRFEEEDEPYEPEPVDVALEELARTDPAGHFAFDSMETSLVIGASRNDTRATMAIRLPATDLVLRLEEVAWLTVLAPSKSPALVTLYSGKRRVVRQFIGSVQLRVPLGELQARALTVQRGELRRASQQLEVKAGVKNVLALEFNDAPMVNGVVVDARGAPLAGVNVGLLLAPSNPGSLPGIQERTLTDAQGRFGVAPRQIRGGDPVYEVHLLPPWKEKSEVRVRLGDSPVTVVAVE